MDWSTHVVSATTSDTNPSVVVTFDSGKYIFNVGENTTRTLLHAGSVGTGGWKRMRAVFLTQLTPERVSGLPGFIMTLADTSSSQISVVGPPGLAHFISAMRFCTYRDSMPVNLIETSSIHPESYERTPNPIFKDENISVYSIPIYPQLSCEQTYGGNKTVLQDSQHENLKRKHPSSTLNEAIESGPPRKRANTSEASFTSPGLAELVINADKFTAAQEWRNKLVKCMFPATYKPVQSTTPDKVAQKQKEKGKGKSDNKGNQPKEKQKEVPDIVTSPGVSLVDGLAGRVDEYKRRNLPLGYYNQLPTFAQSPISARTTQSYIIVGPRIRGKFNSARAKELGVPNGPLCGRLTKGESVTFEVKVKVKKTVKDVNGTEKIIEVQEVEQRTVDPDEVMGKSEAPGAILVLDVPTTSHIPSLLSTFTNSDYYRHFRSKGLTDSGDFSDVGIIYHVLGEGVLEDRRYGEFLQGFNDNVHHIVSSPQYLANPISFTNAAYYTLRFNQLDQEMFPLLHSSLRPPKSLQDVTALPAGLKVYPMIAGTLTKMRPLSPPSLPPLSTVFAMASANQAINPIIDSDVIAGIEKIKDRYHSALLDSKHELLPGKILAEFSSANLNVKQTRLEKQKLATSENDNGDDRREQLPKGKGTHKGRDVIVTPLGTGSALPSKYRNVSSTLIQIPTWGNILLDAGEGTLGQLIRKFGDGTQGTPSVVDVLRNLKCLFVSHAHADHHLGVAQLLARRSQLDPPPTSPLYLVSIRNVHLYLRELSNIQNLGIVLGYLNNPVEIKNGVVPIMSDALHFKDHPTSRRWQPKKSEPWLDSERSRAACKKMCESLGLETFETVEVCHRTQCYGAVIKSREGWSIVFSGDTEPSDNLVWAGKGATLLIHEATMADGQEELAKRKAHSTYSQAIDIGKRMFAENILLTHFSARYPKLPPPAAPTTLSGVNALELAAEPDPVDGRCVAESENIHRSLGPATSPQRITDNGGQRTSHWEPVIALAFDHADYKIGEMWKFGYYVKAFEQTFSDMAGEEEDEDVVAHSRTEVDMT